LWLVWLEGALHKIDVVGWWLHFIWIVSIVVLGPLLVFGSDVVRQHVSDVYLVRSLGLGGAALVMATVAGRFTFVTWWLRTLPGERLRRYLRARVQADAKNEASSSFVEHETSTRIEVGLRRAPRITVEMCLPFSPPQR
jgi:hypothetical protein